jgi:hypothetical protein
MRGRPFRRERGHGRLGIGNAFAHARAGVIDIWLRAGNRYWNVHIGTQRAWDKKKPELEYSIRDVIQVGSLDIGGYG